jgi:flagellar hook protein FlgE
MQVNVSSLNAHNNWMANNANNIANVNTKDYKAADTVLKDNTPDSVTASTTKSNSDTNLTKDLTNQIPIVGGFDANVQAIKTQEETVGSILNILV